MSGLRGTRTPSSKKTVAKKKITKAKAKKRKLSSKQMECRVPGCHKRSMGPRYSFKCKKHENTEVRPNLTVLKGGNNGNGKSSKVAPKAPPNKKAA
jgi:hypothetical protein